MKVTIKSVNGNPACSSYFVDEQTRLAVGQYIEIDGRSDWNKALLEQIDDEAAEELELVEPGNVTPTVDAAAQGHAANLEKQIEKELGAQAEKDAEIAALKAQLAEKAESES